MLTNFISKLARHGFSSRVVVGVAVLALGGFSAAEADPLLQALPLEQDRVSPSRPAKNLPLQNEPGKVDYLLYNHLRQDEPNVPILYLKIPEEYVGASRGPVHNFGVHFYVWYPEMTGSFNPANKERVKCLGYCNGKIHMSIDNKLGFRFSADTRAELFHDRMNEYLRGEDKYHVYLTIKSNFDDEIYIKRRVLKPFEGETSVFYMLKSPEGKYLHFAECRPDVPSPSCDAFLNISNNHGISISYSFSMSMLKDWTRVREAVERTINSFSPSFLQPEIGKKNGD